MYAKPQEVEEYLKQNSGRPYISCEYMHAMGNSLGGLSLYTDLEDKYEAYQGGFIWDYIDQAIETKMTTGKWFWLMAEILRTDQAITDSAPMV